MNKLRLFSTETEYNTSKSGFEYPTVSYIKAIEDVRYMTLRDKYTREYLTFEALEDGTFTFTMTANLPTTCVPSISYSTDNGETWSTTANVDNQEVVVTTPTITSGNKVLWKSEAVQFCSNPDSYPGGNMGYGSFSSSGNYNVCGNIMSLIYGDNFIENNDFKTYVSTGVSAGVFSYIFGRNNTRIVAAENLILPHTNLAQYCYQNMFNGCTALTTAPKLPSTTLALGCYQNMFYGCTALTTAPKLPTTILANSCYKSMFSHCTSLTKAPVLPAETLANSCYEFMFSHCTSLTTAPVLPATTLASSCYSGMFYNCTALTTAPVLPATTLAQDCYDSMFNGCTSLNYIKAMFTTTPSATYTANWVSGVAATGTFVKNANATWTTTGNNGVPTGWTVETASA